MKRIFLLAVILFLGTSVSLFSQDRPDPEAWIKQAEEVLSKTDSYTVIFHKQERSKGVLGEEETIFLKFKKPFKVYMKWIKPPHKGRELMYMKGWNNNRLKVHEGGISGIFNFNLEPEGDLGMKGSRHPVTDTGLENIVRVIGRDLRRGVKAAEVTFKDHGEEMIYGRATREVEGIFPKDMGKGYYCFRAVIYFDVETRIPTKVMIYDWDDELVENYGYEDLRLDAGLTDADFDPGNPEYRF
jgi:outer membrane lipoprotein-sorting protein